MCLIDEASRTVLAALAPAHRLRLLTLVSRGRAGWRACRVVLCCSRPLRAKPRSSTHVALPQPPHCALAQIVCQRVSRAYIAEQASRQPAVAAAQDLSNMLARADSGPFAGAFGADPLVVSESLLRALAGA